MHLHRYNPWSELRQADTAVWRQGKMIGKKTHFIQQRQCLKCGKIKRRIVKER